MAGMDLLLKNIIGMTPDEIKKKLDEALSGVGQTLAHFDARLVALEKAQQANQDLLLQILALLNGEKPNGQHEHSDPLEHVNGG